MSKNERLARLKNELVSKPHEVCSERAILITQAYNDIEEAKPLIIRKAEIFRRLLEKMTIYILDDELIVGGYSEKQRGAPLFPEYCWDWCLAELDDYSKRKGDPYEITEKTKEELKQVLPLWKGKSRKETVLAMLPEETRQMCQCEVVGLDYLFESTSGHFNANFEKLLLKGFNGIKADAEEERRKLQEEQANPSIEFLEQDQFLQAVIICCDAATAFGKRYASLAREMAEKAGPKRKAELLKIAGICDHVPGNPARTFHEALQSTFFADLMFFVESNGFGIGLGRADQWLYPTFKKDLDEGRITKEEAYGLVGCFWIKLQSNVRLYSWPFTMFYMGYNNGQNLVTGGLKKDGSDAENELSHIMLDVTGDLRLHSPSVTARIHKHCSNEWLQKCIDTFVKHGGGMPALHNDEAYVNYLMSAGYSAEDSLNYALVGCVETSSPGVSFGHTGGSFFSFPKILELALNNGRCSEGTRKMCPMATDPEKCKHTQLGPQSGDLATFKSIDEVKEAYRQQMEYTVHHGIVAVQICDQVQRLTSPLPYTSALNDDCITKRKDFTSGGARYNTSGEHGGTGIANVANALAVIQKLVFEEKKITGTELTEAVNNNFESKDGERIRRIIMNEVPKYGNDDDFVDSFGREAFNCFFDAVARHRNIFGEKLLPGTAPASANMAFGTLIGATVDGRKSGKPVSDGISPAQGTDICGPVAALNSVGKLEHRRAWDGLQLNQKLTMDCLRTEEERAKVRSLVRGYFYSGGSHIQYNVVSRETLVDAQRHPEKYRDLTIRVAGYSAYFTSLSPEIQQDIIDRTEHTI